MKRLLCSSSLFVAAAFSGLGCGGLRSATSLVGQDPNWGKLTLGTKVAIYAEGACPERFAADRAELESGGGVSLGAAVWAQSAATYNIVESYGAESQPGKKGGGVYLKLSGNGQLTWVHTDSSFGCVFPEQAALTTEALAEKGKAYAFTPWVPACKQITGSGIGFADAALSIEVPKATSVDSLRLTKAGLRYALGNGAFVVDQPTLETCFSKPGAGARSDFDYLANLKIEPSRCEVSTFQGKTLVECRSTVGLWAATETGLTLSRRTLGPVFFLDGHPVSGGRFARNVVAVTTAAPQNDRQRALYRGIDGAVARAVASGDDSVRVAPPGDPAITRTVRISIGDVTIGDLVRRETTETSKFKVREATAANPDKEPSRVKMQELELKYADATGRCNRGSAGSDCKEKLREVDKLMQTARAAFAKIPSTVTTTVIGDWQYKKTTYARSIAATIVTETASVLGKPVRSEDKLSFEFSDFEVVADAEHNVAGHAPQRELIDNPDATLPAIATKAGETAATALRRALRRGALDAAMKAFGKAGGSSRPGYEAVDAAAFDAVGERLLAGEAFGEGTGPIAAPTLKLSPSECLLAAAVATADGAQVSLTAGIYADERGKGVATLEICQNELGAEGLPALTLTGTGRWAIYKTNGVQAEDGHLRARLGDDDRTATGRSRRARVPQEAWVTTDSLLYEGPLARVTLERDGRLVRITRTAARFTTEGLASLAPLATDVLPRSQRANRALLLDVRAAPLLGDDDVERRVGAFTMELFGGFVRTAVLVGTAVGRLQVNRFGQQNEAGARVFVDEAAALAHLLS